MYLFFLFAPKRLEMSRLYFALATKKGCPRLVNSPFIDRITLKTLLKKPPTFTLGAKPHISLSALPNEMFLMCI